MDLRHALHEPADDLRPLPAPAAELLTALNAPPRLGAHLRAVHDVAVQLLDWLDARHPGLPVDRHAVQFGAATHDIGKVMHPDELSGPGSKHEPAGYQLLLDHGVPAALARFARFHANWTRPETTAEDLLVSLADKVWKARRVTDLEHRLLDRLTAASGEEPWQAFLTLDDELTRIAAGADRRLAYQASYPAG